MGAGAKLALVGVPVVRRGVDALALVALKKGLLRHKQTSTSVVKVNQVHWTHALPKSHRPTNDLADVGHEKVNLSAKLDEHECTHMYVCTAAY